MYLSGIRPTGRLHLGNYLGCIKPFKELQTKDSIFFIANMHSEYKGNTLIPTYEILEKYGIKATIEQTFSEEILSIAHELSFHVSTGALSRMTQFKDKSKTEDPTLNLFAYPVLMAADIFYFEQPKVIIGADQKQHIEFARDLADKTGYIKPEPVFSEMPRVMNLQDATEKMSKSSQLQRGVIYLDDSKDEIARKIRKAKPTGAERDNLLSIYKALGGKENHTKNGQLKEELTELLIKQLEI